MSLKVTRLCKTMLPAVLACWICMSAAGAQNKPLDVCEVLQNLSRYRGQMITVRGEFVGNAIDGTTCPVLKTGDHEWHKGVLIDIPHESYAPIDPPAAWKIELKNWDRAVEKWQALKKRWGGGTPVFATIVGRLDTKSDPLEVPTLPNGNSLPWGYGHLGIYPARLVLFDIKDVEVSTNRGR